MSDTEEIGLGLDSVFTEPPRPPSPEPTTVTYVREAQDGVNNDWSEVSIRLVGSHPLWGHYLWNASRAFASYLNAHPELYRDRAVLELGAGGGLPGIVAAKNGARTVVLTDYPDASLLENLNFNVSKNVPSSSQESLRVKVKGYIWGRPVGPLLESLDVDRTKYDLIIMSDLIFNHSQHDALLKTCEETLSSNKSNEGAEPGLLVFYTHHRPHLAHRDMEFFSKAKERGWDYEEILTQRFPPMFPEDPGEEEVRATVHGWRLTRRS
ncbi:nicotinamide N-methyltransferase [Fomitopsis serialis]|uniref:nicotinamide N-methyltransferase n=1 Tax=Fomitopsis serialis TaxID=139415 RepID=UPI0020075BD1|nr:nicotinamide N-methyltransferase [Neoantrodia serialis]KAH9918645.1 nicotinamide N-methyltransferase [Neoantrodia serialis]